MADSEQLRIDGSRAFEGDTFDLSVPAVLAFGWRFRLAVAAIRFGMRLLGATAEISLQRASDEQSEHLT